MTRPVRAPLLGPRIAERRSCGKAEGGPDPLVVRAYGVVPAQAWEPPDPDPLLADIEAARRACERSGWRAPAPRPWEPSDPACREALEALPVLERAIRKGDRAIAYEAIRPLARALRPEAPASGKRAAGGGSA